MPPTRPRVARACVACGRTFYRLPSVLRQRPARHCSRACLHGDPGARFWAAVDRGDGDGCWRWTAGIDRQGQGRFRPRGHAAALAAAEFAYALAHGAVPAGQTVRQRCGDPRCVRPDHLLLIPAVDGVPTRPADAPVPHSRLTWATVATIRARYAAGGVRQQALAAEYGLSPGQMSRLLRGASWRPAEAAPPSTRMAPLVSAAGPGLDPRTVATRARLAAALRALVAEEGYATRTTLARRAGVAAPTIRRHWAAALALAGLVEERRRFPPVVAVPPPATDPDAPSADERRR